MQEVPSQSQVIEVAKEYARLIRERLTGQELDDVVWGHNDEDDFIDNNMVMHAAMYRYHTHFDLDIPFYNTLWNEAYRVAKLNDFYVKK
jgi:hypothetical protein